MDLLPPCQSVPRRSPGHRAVRERRAMRQVQTLQLTLSRHRMAMGIGASSTCSSVHRLQLAEMRRVSLVRRRAMAAAAQACASIAQPSAQQQQHPSLPPSSSPPAARAASSASAVCTAEAVMAPVGNKVPLADTAKVTPELYLLGLLEKRGQTVRKLSSSEAGYQKRPTAKQILDYQSQPFMSDLARRGDVDGLKRAVEAGRGMDASNKFGESVVHIACRRGNMEVLRFLVANGGSLTCCDDLGRFPLHEVCWSVQPRFDIVRLFLDDAQNATKQAAATATATAEVTMTSSTMTSTTATVTKTSDGPNLLLVTDARGCTPLRYVKEDSWPEWRRFLDEIVDEYWPSLV